MNRQRGGKLRAYPKWYVSSFTTTLKFIRFCLLKGCGSFWLKKECSSLGVSIDTPPFGNSFLSFQKSSATRQMRIFRGSLKNLRSVQRSRRLRGRQEIVYYHRHIPAPSLKISIKEFKTEYSSPPSAVIWISVPFPAPSCISSKIEHAFALGQPLHSR